MTIKRFASNNGTLPAYNKNNRGDMITAIKAALITGYKDKSSADWELLYESISDPSDNTSRIVVRSKDFKSEQKAFEIIDITAHLGKINCYQDWQDGQGIGLLMSANINKNISWANNISIYADDKFVSMFVNNCYTGFGDVEVFDSVATQTVLFDCQTTGENDDDQAIGCSVNPHLTGFKTADGFKLVCRSFCKNHRGYGAAVSYTGAPHHLNDAGGDTEALTTGIETPVRKTELLKLQSDNNKFTPYGYLPHMLYTDNPHTMHNKTLLIDGRNIKINKQLAMGSGFLPMMESV